MALHESDREDLYNELHLAHSRWEIRRDGRQNLAVAAVREGGRFLIYFDPEETFQFDGESRLLRSYQNGFLYRTQGSTLARLQRHRTRETSELIRRDLSPAEVNDFLENLAKSIQLLLSELQSGAAMIVRTNLSEEMGAQALTQHLQRCLDAGPCLAPPYPTRRK